MARLVDLSHVIEAGMVTYPGLPGPVISDHLSRVDSRANYAAGTEFLIGRIDMVGNTGTYLDTPFHRFDGGSDLAALALDDVADLPGVCLETPGPEIGPDAIDGRTRIIAVDMPNVEGIENVSWETYRTTIREIEQKTELDLFSQHPRELQDAIETRNDLFGLAVTLAARVCGRARAGEVLVSEPVRAAAPEAARFWRRGRFALKGVSDRIALYEALPAGV